MVVDTNIFIYVSQTDSPFHERAVEALKRFRSQGKYFTVTTQILQEYLAVSTREHKRTGKPKLELIVENYHLIATGCEVLFDTETSVQLLQEYAAQRKIAGVDVYDANIVAVMVANGEKEILTNNPNDFLPFRDLISVITLDATN